MIQPNSLNNKQPTKIIENYPLSAKLWLKIFCYLPDHVTLLPLLSKRLYSIIRNNPEVRNIFFGLIAKKCNRTLIRQFQNEIQLTICYYSLFNYFADLLDLHTLSKCPNYIPYFIPNIKDVWDRNYKLKNSNIHPIIWGIYNSEIRFIEIHGRSVNNPSMHITYIISQRVISKYWALIQHVQDISFAETLTLHPEGVFRILPYVRTDSIKEYFKDFTKPDSQGQYPFRKGKHDHVNTSLFRLKEAPKE